MPTLMASLVESPVPQMTGVPSARPVSAAACAVTCPAIPCTSIARANWSPRQNRPASASLIAPVSVYSGSNEDFARNRSITYSPVSFAVT